MARKHFFGRIGGYVWKHWTTTRKSHIGHAGQMEDAVAVQEQSKYASPTDDAHTAVWSAQLRHRLFEGGALRVPIEDFFIGWIDSERGNAAGYDQSTAQ